MARIPAYIAIVALLTVAASCQKGPEDPVFSVVSRKGRLAGNWSVDTMYLQQGNAKSWISGDSLYVSIDDSLMETFGTEWKYVFQRDGGYEFTIVEHHPEQMGEMPYTRNFKEEGFWEFTGGNSAPAKSKLALFAEQITESRSDQGSNVEVTAFQDPATAVVFDLIKLSNTELIMHRKTVISTAFGSDTTEHYLMCSKQ
ncbi:MAG: hypothetical protein Kow0075_13540 [Salibacteraceae bacterium]